MKKLLLILLTFCYLSGYSQIIITATNTPSTQNFNSLANTGSAITWTNNSTITGWYAYRTSGTAVVATYDSGTGSSNSGQLYSFGTSMVAERALGSTSSGTPLTFLYGTRVVNNTGSLVKSVTISYTGEQWRNGGNTTAHSLTFDYQQTATFTDFSTGPYTTVSGLNFTGPVATATAGALDGNATANRINITFSFNVDIPIGQEIILRWTDINDAGNDHGLAIDDFSVSFLTTLPISLTSFTGKEANKSIVLNWVTASEKNNKNFELLRSVDGKNFKSIGTVSGAGDSDAELKYSFVDANPFGGTNYYQLKQIDFDGKNSISSTIAVVSKIAETQITVYAASSSVNIGITSPNETEGKISLFDISGRKITEQNINLNKGYNTLDINETLTPGIHFVTLENEGKIYRQKFIK